MFADSVLEILYQKDWIHHHEAYQEWFESWILMMFKIIDFEDQLVECLQALFSQEYSVTSALFLQPFIKRKVRD